MRIRDIMTVPVATCGPLSNLATVAELLWRNDCGIVPVVDETGRVDGVVTDRDVCIAVGTKGRPAGEITVSEIPGKKLYTCYPDDDVSMIFDRMSSGRVRRLPVVDKAGKLLGIVSINDLILRATPDGAKGVSDAQVMRVLRAVCAHEESVKKATRKV